MRSNFLLFLLASALLGGCHFSLKDFSSSLGEMSMEVDK